MPSLPQELRQKLKMNQNLHDEDINFLLSSPAAYQFFSEVKQLSKADEKMIANWLRGSFAAALNDANLGFEHSPLSAAKFAPLLSLLAEQKISVKIAKQIFTKLWAGEGTVEDILHKEGYGQIHDDDLLESIVRAVINQHPQQVADFQAGKDKLLGFFMGQVMKQTGGQAAPEQIHSLLKKYLNNSQ